MGNSLGTAAVMGAGAWGTAVAKVLADAGNDVRLWARRARSPTRSTPPARTPAISPVLVLPAGIRATVDPAEALDGVTTVVLGVPSQTLRLNLEEWRTSIADGATLVSLAKGIELGTLMRMSQVIIAVTGASPVRVAVVSGPNLAAEIAAEQPAATVVACSDSGRAVALQRALSTGYLRPYTNSDVAGMGSGGACKNVIALACGMAAGVGLGGEHRRSHHHHPGTGRDHATGYRPGCQDRDALAGLAGVGDLVATCTSPHSRNRAFGFRLGRGESLDAARRAVEGHVAEGVSSCTSILALAASSYDVEMPAHELCTGSAIRGCPSTRPSRCSSTQHQTGWT